MRGSVSYQLRKKTSSCSPLQIDKCFQNCQVVSTRRRQQFQLSGSLLFHGATKPGHVARGLLTCFPESSWPGPEALHPEMAIPDLLGRRLGASDRNRLQKTRGTVSGALSRMQACRLCTDLTAIPWNDCCLQDCMPKPKINKETRRRKRQGGAVFHRSEWSFPGEGAFSSEAFGQSGGRSLQEPDSS